MRLSCEFGSQCAHRCMLKIKRRHSHLIQSHTIFYSTHTSSRSYHQSKYHTYQIDSTPFYTHHLVYQALTTMKNFILLLVACTFACVWTAPVEEFVKKTAWLPMNSYSDDPQARIYEAPPARQKCIEDLFRVNPYPPQPQVQYVDESVCSHLTYLPVNSHL